jgi:dTDP-4-amino-4,6-dideoxygalactose transaminase
MTMRAHRNSFRSNEGILNLSDWRIPLSSLDYGPEEEAAVQRVIKSGWLSMGPEVARFEEEFAEFLGVKHAIAVSNGTAAIHLAFMALNLKPGDEVIQPAINFVAAANMTVAVGASPVFADIVSLNEPNIDPADIERCITPKTCAVVVMHYGGYLCRMAEISGICKEHGLALIEDACHAVGARYRNKVGSEADGKMAGTLGDVGCFSFFSNKNLATGEGGMVVTNRADLAERLRLLRSHGMTSLTWDRHRGHASTYDVLVSGYNYRLDELHAALGRVQLQKLEKNNALRRNLSNSYRKRLSTLYDWIIPFSDYEGDTSAHLMVAVAPDQEARSNVRAALRNERIQTSMHYPIIPSFAVFKAKGSETGNETISLNQSTAFSQRALTLPLFSSMKDSEVAEVSLVVCGTPKPEPKGDAPTNASLDAGAR